MGCIPEWDPLAVLGSKIELEFHGRRQHSSIELFEISTFRFARWQRTRKAINRCVGYQHGSKIDLYAYANQDYKVEKALINLEMNSIFDSTEEYVAEPKDKKMKIPSYYFGQKSMIEHPIY